MVEGRTTAEFVAKRWDLDIESTTAMRDAANLVLRFRLTDGSTRIAKGFGASDARARQEADLVTYLADLGFPAVPPIPVAATGELVAVVEGRPWCVYVDAGPALGWDLAGCREVGRLLARLHHLTVDSQAVSLRDVSPIAQVEEALAIFGHALEGVARNTAVRRGNELAEGLGELRADDVGLVHGDPNPKNIVGVSGAGSFSMVDFEHAGLGWRLLDVAVAVSVLPASGLSAFRSAYEAEHSWPATADEKFAFSLARRVIAFVGVARNVALAVRRGVDPAEYFEANIDTL